MRKSALTVIKWNYNYNHLISPVNIFTLNCEACSGVNDKLVFIPICCVIFLVIRQDVPFLMWFDKFVNNIHLMDNLGKHTLYFR